MQREKWLRDQTIIEIRCMRFTRFVQREGVRGLYAGYWACMSVHTFFSAFSFFFYERLKNNGGYAQMQARIVRFQVLSLSHSEWLHLSLIHWIL
ncbi:unnamed protein product [Albugo candida]|uniref:Uncharacterized protein n=1 Tax=Albugo candida TaxID=65357 RepID=A0A024FWF2_9STRA|nr:unnamed protein product [Albugo candida]|eukprot:CCI11257.1 unnamed protein product [Albugo candida]